MPNERLIMDVNNSCMAFLANFFFFLLPCVEGEEGEGEGVRAPVE